jgi:hypothetical protein
VKASVTNRRRDAQHGLVYAAYQLGEHEVDLVERAFGRGSKRGSKLDHNQEDGD